MPAQSTQSTIFNLNSKITLQYQDDLALGLLSIEIQPNMPQPTFVRQDQHGVAMYDV